MTNAIQNVTIYTTDGGHRWHGRAWNGSTYRGTTIGSGYDCEIVRTSARSALACLTNLVDRSESMVPLDIDMETDLQSLSEEIAANPGYDAGEPWVADDSDEWDALAEMWDAAKERLP